MIYITGDTHGDLSRIEPFRIEHRLKKDDVMIILGDVGLNFFLNSAEKALKEVITRNWPFTLFCIHGNHEQRPETIPSYKSKMYRGGIVYYEEDYPNILFAKDGEIYDFNKMKTLVCGGASSLDKSHRIEGVSWWRNETPSDEIKQRVMKKLDMSNWKVDVVLTHTAPKKYEPVEAFVSWIKQENVDKSTEEFLDSVEDKLTYKKWYFGHYHINKHMDKITILYDDIEEFKI